MSETVKRGSLNGLPGFSVWSCGRTVDASGRHLGQFESALLQEGDGHLHAVVGGTLQQQGEHLQTQHLVGLTTERC